MNKLHDQINKKKSFLCIGLDIDKNKIPKSILELDDPIFEFAKRIIDSTNEYAIAYKPILHFLRLMVQMALNLLIKSQTTLIKIILKYSL